MASEVGTNSSVGKAFSSHQIYSIDHPRYRQFAEQVENELKNITEREVERRSTAQPLVFTSSLSSEESSRLASSYPEFAVKTVPLNNRVHAYWAASRLCANEWLATITAQYSNSAIHYGGSLVSSIGQRRRNHHIEYDASDEVMVNDNHTDVVDLHRLYGDFVKAQTEYQLALPRTEYDDYLRSRSYGTCGAPHKCTHTSGALCVDLTVTPLSPDQVALAMIQHGAELCHGFFPYCPEMLVQDEGELGSSGVSFKRKDVNMYFSYPEGRAGVSYYPLSVWAKWVSSHTFKVGASKFAQGKWFQLELMKHRDCFMFFRMVQVPEPDGPVKVEHALDLPQNEGMVVVKSWSLKKNERPGSLSRDAWVPKSFLVRERIVKRVYEFAMQLTPQQFSRFAIKKQIRVINNRWVVNGTSVVVAPALEPRVIEDLATAIFSRAFVDRYTSSKLSSEMMSALSSMQRFAGSGVHAQVECVARATASRVYLSTVGKLEKGVRTLLDYIRDYADGALSTARNVALVPAPTYASLASEANAWRTSFRATAERYLVDDRDVLFSQPIATSLAGSLATVVASHSPRVKYQQSVLSEVVRLCTKVVDVRVAGKDPAADELVDKVASLNEMDFASERRYHMEFEVPMLEANSIVSDFAAANDPDPVGSLNDLYASVFPTVARQALEYDTFSLSLDPQDRTLAAPYLRMPTYFGLPPAVRSYYRSRLKALNVPKRQNTGQELLTAINARNLSAPSIAAPQEDLLIKEIWENFLDTMCVENAREKLAEYQEDSVALAEDSLRDWASKAKPEVISRVVSDLSSTSRSLEQMPINEYLAMLKADVKPTLSTKPVTEVTAPQVIVYHEKPLSALYSSIFRVLVQRFLSLLKPNIFVNLLKDTRHMAQLLTAVHPFSESGLQYLENDFSKYDKSQSQFAFDLEHYVFTQLGMNKAMLSNWLGGHIDCSIRAITVGLSLHVLYQRKSGDATTAFGNVILNVLSVAYAYRGSNIVWALFMGDDSLVCVRTINCSTEPIRVLAEVFNLTAKYYITEAPYFASNFVILDEGRLEVFMVPDPIKRIERLSMHVSAEDPQWDERHESFSDSMSAFTNETVVVQALARAVPLRYEVPEGLVRAAATALGTLVRDKQAFRSLWHDEPEIIEG